MAFIDAALPILNLSGATALSAGIRSGQQDPLRRKLVLRRYLYGLCLLSTFT
jgi:hypothetical protein